jgi:phage shock protein PspC (stress-responsive transcriptional regulator)
VTRTVELVELAPPSAEADPTPLPPPTASEGDERVIGGVAALLAERLQVDPLWLRIAFVLLALVAGVGILLYGALWLAFVVGSSPDRVWARIAGGVLLVFGLPWMLTQGFAFVDGWLAVFALLAGLAVALWQPRRDSLRGAATAPLTTTPGAPDSSAGGMSGGLPHPGPRRRRPSRPPSMLGRLTLGLAVLVAAAGAMIDEVNGGRLHPEQWLGAAAVVCGVGLLVGTVVGRARWLFVPAAAFAVVGFVAGEAARLGLDSPELIDDESVFVGTGDPGGRSVSEHVVIGSVDVLVDGAPVEPVAIDARVAIGTVRVTVADDVPVEVRTDADHGDVRVDGAERADGTVRVGPDGSPAVIVTAVVGRGDVEIDHVVDVVPPFRPRLPELQSLGSEVAEGVVIADRGVVVLAGGEAVIGADDRVLSGSTEIRDRAVVIFTSEGEYELLDGGLLLTPFGELLDLPALRAFDQGAVPDTAPLPTEPAEPVEPTEPADPATPGG